MFKLAAGIGKLLKIDQSTLNKDSLMYERILVESSMNQKYHEYIEFENKKVEMKKQKIDYEWRPFL